MQISITLSEIQNLATNGKVYARGKALAQSSQLQVLYYLDNIHGLLAKVKSSNSDTTYTVQITLSQRDRPKRISCNCPAARQYLGCCKHMVAVLVRAMNEKLENLPIWQGQVPEVPADFARGRKPYVEEEAETSEQTKSPAPFSQAEKNAMPETVARTTSADASAAAIRSTSIEQNTATSSSTDPYSLAEQTAPARLMQLRAIQARDLDVETEDDSAELSLAFDLHLQLPRLTSEIALLSAQIRLTREDQSKSYKIKQMDAFLQSVASGGHHFFGQALDFDPKVHRFNAAGERFLQWLLQLWNRSVERQPYEYIAKSSAFAGSNVVLNPKRLWEFFDGFANNIEDLSLKISWGQNDPPSPAQVHNGFPPLTFSWAKSAQTHFDLLSLTLRDAQDRTVHVYSPQALKAKEDSEDLRLLTRDGALLLYQRTIYRLEAQDVSTATARLLLTQLALSEGQSLDFSPKHAGDFLTRIYPSLHQSDMLVLAPEQAKNLVHEELKTFVWLDQDGKGIRLQLAFAYGPYMINPHPLAEDFTVLMEDGPNNAAGESLLEVGTSITPPLIVRDYKKEAQFLRLAKQFRFLTQAIRKKSRSTLLDNPRQAISNTHHALGASSYYLFGETSLMEFLSSGLSALQEQGAELYLSRRFKQLMVRPLASFHAQLRFDRSNNMLSIDLEDWPYSAEDMQQILSAYREKRGYARLKDGSFVEWSKMQAELDDAELSDAALESLELLNTFEHWGAKQTDNQLVLPAFRAVPLAKLLSDQINTGKTQTRIRDSAENSDLTTMLHDLCEPAGLKFPVPEQVKKVLRNYQKTGFNWLCSLDYYGFGGILADDMGLGKTLQALAYIAFNKKTRPEPVLVAAPTSLIYNWLAEAEKFLPELKVLLLEGTKKLRLSQIEEIASSDVVVCSYAVLRQDIKELRAFEFSAFFIDEAQFIKNPATQTAKAVKKINAQRRFALTGTPIENSLSELWSIFDFLMPGYLFTQSQFQEQLELPIAREQNKAALAELRMLTEPFILRRLKKDVLKELPDKIETELLCDMSPAQDKLYYAYLSGAREELRQMRDEAEYRKSQMQVLTLLTRLRQLCCHPALFLHDYDGGSGKLDALDELLDNLLESGHNSLIFSQFTSLLQLVAARLEARDIAYFYLDGSVSARDRLSMANRYNAGEVRIFLISLRAGGTGLNLIGADTVIHLDPWWNPAVEDQATDRAHRIGQRKVVQIFRLIARGSIEEKITALKDEKRQLISSVIQAGEDGLQKLSLEELRDLLG